MADRWRLDGDCGDDEKGDGDEEAEELERREEARTLAVLPREDDDCRCGGQHSVHEGKGVVLVHGGRIGAR